MTHPLSRRALSLANSLARDRGGATSIEYGLILSLIFLVILGAVTAFGNTSSGVFNLAMNTLRGAMGG